MLKLVGDLQVRDTALRDAKEAADVREEAHRRSERAKAHVKDLTSGLSSLQDAGDEYTTKVEYEVQRREENRKAVSKLRAAHRRIKDDLVRCQGEGSITSQLKTTTRNLEHRIYIARKKSSQLDKRISGIKQDVNDARSNILYQDQRRRSLEDELHRSKIEVAAVVETANSAYSRRAAALESIRDLEQRHSRMETEFENEWNALGKVMESKEDKYQKQFTRMRLGSPTATRELESNIIEQFKRDEVRLKKAVIAGNWTNAKSRIATQIFNEKVHTFEEAFKKVQELTDVSSLEELVEYMARAEDQNFRAFNHLSDMNNEITELEQAITSLQTQIEDSQNQTTVYSQFKRQVIRELQAKFDRANEETTELEETWQNYSRQVDTLKPLVREIFFAIDCSMFPACELIDINNPSDSELLQCLGLIEQRVNEILHVFSCVANVARIKARSLDTYQTFHTPDIDVDRLGEAPTALPTRSSGRNSVFRGLTGLSAHSNTGNARSKDSEPGASKAADPEALASPSLDKGQSSSTAGSGKAAITGPMFPHGACQVHVKPPEISDLDSDDEEGDLMDVPTEFNESQEGSVARPLHREDLDMAVLLTQTGKS